MNDTYLHKIALERAEIKEKRSSIQAELSQMDTRLKELEVIERFLKDSNPSAGVAEPKFHFIGQGFPNASVLPNRRIRLGMEKQKIYQAMRLMGIPLSRNEIAQITRLVARDIRGSIRDGVNKGDIVANSDNKYSLTPAGMAILEAVEKRDTQATVGNVA